MNLMIQGTSSGAGKSTLVTALCRILSDEGYAVAPFKSQNMSSFSYDAGNFEISRAQYIQGIAARCNIISDLNPILLKPLGDNTSTIYLNGRRLRRADTKWYYGNFVNSRGIRAACAALGRLEREHDIVILEGAGSPAEINMARFDIANMRMASAARASVILVSDIERGGSFASIAGTITLMPERDARRIAGYVLNKFRGDPEILKSGFRKMYRITGLPSLGVIPMLDVGLPEEDSLGAAPQRTLPSRRTLERRIDRLADYVRDALEMKRIREIIKS